MRRALGVIGSLVLACSGPSEGVPEGKLAVVGEVAFGPEDLAAVQAQLGAYAQLRFRGDAGSHALLGALVDAEVLAQRAVARGLGDDPRVRFALLEEIAAVHLTSELERRVPRAAIAGDEAKLRAWYDAHVGELVQPERRSAEGVVVNKWAKAEELHARMLEGVALEELGDVVHTEIAARDDREFPGFHAVLFDPALGEGDALPHPVPIGERLLVGRVLKVEAAAAPAFDDPATRERAVEAVRAQLLESAEAELQRELAQRFPESG
ncbi:MAG TPA: peptidylprolyl isomerase [Nannocystaceae bacterium]|nr:peptidylprolyl isomerase [Nannocystaceae bacterium]